MTRFNMNRRITMTALRRRRREDLPRRGLAPKPQPCEVAAVHQWAQHDRRPPDQLSEGERRPYVLSLLHDKKVAENTCRIPLEGMRCFSARTLKRPWPVFDLVRPRQRQTLPVVLSPQEGRALRTVVHHRKARRCRRLISAGGLRRRDGTPLPVADIAPQRMVVRVRQGTGGKDRLVPLAPRGLELVRAYWQRERPRPWWCPARHRPAPRSPPSLHKTCTAVGRQRGIPNEAAIPTLRHA
jgi:integrase/recombinase XerD